MAGLRLRAEDIDDLRVLSAYLQDAIAKTGDLDFDPRRRRFAAMFNRFCWENAPNRRRGPFRRVRTGVHFDDVKHVQVRGVDLQNGEQVLELLAIQFEPGEEGGGIIELAFAGNATIRLDVECIEAHLTDVTGAWLTARKPEHPDTSS